MKIQKTPAVTLLEKKFLEATEMFVTRLQIKNPLGLVS